MKVKLNSPALSGTVVDTKGATVGEVVDNVNHPAHYTSHPSGVECITITEHYNFNLGNSLKYIWRAGLKGGLVEDLKKARWYLDRELARIARSEKIK